ncbi:MAG: TIGR00341 family protein [uncultured Sulfurovum sp.]|uniref:TIGR00341 family protein n=1 Tax=uncultured Sulfurovum sp. TaxID=269237 RepID=A0A6S6TRK0_9BACT|nr:MAG: TIGR00341 family protein [uncultured Sulfurovum sp.]
MIYYIYASNKKDFVEEIKQYLLDEEVEYLCFEALDRLKIDDVSHLLVTGCLDEIKLLLAIASQNEISIGVIAHSSQKELMRTFALPSNYPESVALALTKTPKKIDLLYSNGTLVLQEVVVGDAPPLDRFDSTLNGKTYIDRVKMFWQTLKKVKSLQHTPLKISDAKENEVKVSAVGVVGIKHNNDTFASKLISSELSPNNGKLSIVILSPRSMVEYMGYLFQSLVSHLTPKSLPSSVGYMSASTLTIESDAPLEVLIDSTQKQETPIVLEIKQKALALSVGEKFWEHKNPNSTTKNSMRVEHLPSDSENKVYLSQSIPLFTHASTAQYASLFTNLREESRVSKNFIVLLILATMIATFGLFINSSSVIIGAMLLAPLMQPIVSVSMGVLRQDEGLQLAGFKTIVIGVLSVLLTAMFIALFTPIEYLSSEMAGRLSPTILDLFVAIASGVAAAYVKTDEKILGSLAGVAIAVALVPPIAVAGIGLGWMDWSMFFTAFLLFITNLVGIVFAAALTFAILGYSPLHVAKKGIVIWLVIVAIVSVPLYTSFRKMKEDISIQKTLSNTTFFVGKHEVKLTDIELIHKMEIDQVNCKVISSGILTKEEKKILKDEILKSVGKSVEVIVTFRYKL